MLTDQAFDAVVVDLELPKLSGNVLIRELRERGIQVPTLMVSGAPDARIVARHAHTDFISKPFDIDRLEAKVDDLLHETPAARKTPRGPTRSRSASAR
jgi:DNA-binding response OmpR family regulator